MPVICLKANLGISPWERVLLKERSRNWDKKCEMNRKFQNVRSPQNLRFPIRGVKSTFGRKIRLIGATYVIDLWKLCLFQGCQFGQKNAKPLKFGIFRERLDRKFWFGHFLEIWDIWEKFGIISIIWDILTSPGIYNPTTYVFWWIVSPLKAYILLSGSLSGKYTKCCQIAFLKPNFKPLKRVEVRKLSGF